MAMGRDAAAGLWQAVTEGKFKLVPDAAREVAGHYQWFADEMVKRQHFVKHLSKLDGFGGFDSAQRLQAGFEGKAVQAFEALQAAEEAAYRMKASILKAADLTEEVEAANAAAVTAVGRKITDADV
jgi:hypothetical protein